MSLLLPDGITHLGDCPFTLHAAILTALRIISYEEFPIEERPPKRIWLDGDRLAKWWTEVEVAREERYGVKTPQDSGDDYESNALELIARGS